MTLAWHFVGDTLRDGTPIPADGELLHHAGEVAICSSGLHASKRLIDALNYAPGNTICRVECEEIVDEQHDKLVCRKRTILWRIDGEELLREFARKCALDVIHLWDAPQIVIDFLQTGDPKLQAAAEAAGAWDAAEAARDAGAAARAAAWDAAGYAGYAGDAAWAAARATAEAAEATAEAAEAAGAWDAARVAAQAAAWAAARAAARIAQNQRLETMAEVLHNKRNA